MRQDDGLIAAALVVGLFILLGRDTKARTASARQTVNLVPDGPEVRLLPDPPTIDDVPSCGSENDWRRAVSVKDFWRAPATAGRSTERGSSG